MATATITPDQNVVIAEIFIAAPPERVFQAITDPAQVSQWWGQNNLYRVTDRSSDLRVGGKWLSAGVGKDGAEFRVEGEYLEIDPPRRLVHTWIPSYRDLEPQPVHGLHPSGPRKAGTGTRVRLRHEGFAGDAKSASEHGEGWKRVFGWLAAYLERGETVDNRS
jgi:uncharacterized protein YndB with AHSA1/START domain